MRRLAAILILLPLTLAFRQDSGPAQTGATASSGGGGSLAVASIIAPATGNFGTTYTLPITTAVAIGSDVNVLIGGDIGTADALTVTDSKSNCGGYTQKLAQVDASDSLNVWVFNCKITTALTISDHFKVTPTTDAHWFFMAESVAGITSGFDNAQGNTQAVANVTQTTATYTPGHANEAVTACFTTITSGWSAYGNIIGSAATGLATPLGPLTSRYFACEYRIISAATAGTGAMTTTAATFNASGIFGDF